MPGKRSCVALVGFFNVSWRRSEELLLNDDLHILVTYKMDGTLHHIRNASLSQQEQSGDPAFSVGGLCVCFRPSDNWH